MIATTGVAGTASEPDDGPHRYTIRFPAGAESPAHCFRSLTMHDSRDGMRVPDPIDRYRIAGCQPRGELLDGRRRPPDIVRVA